MIPKTKFKNINQYIKSFPKETRSKFEELRTTIIKVASGAEEVISYNLPAFKLNGILVYFAGYAKHIGFYPTSSGILNFQKKISAYKNSKGAVQFPSDKPLPLALITKMVKFRVKENLINVEQKK